MTLSVLELRDCLKAGEIFQIVDVREAEEWAICRLPGAVWMPLGELPLRGPDELDSEAATVLYCHHGVRSAQATSFLSRAGFKRVLNLQGGIEAWAQLVDPSMPRY